MQKGACLCQSKAQLGECDCTLIKISKQNQTAYALEMKQSCYLKVLI